MNQMEGESFHCVLSVFTVQATFEKHCFWTSVIKTPFFWQQHQDSFEKIAEEATLWMVPGNQQIASLDMLL